MRIDPKVASQLNQTSTLNTPGQAGQVGQVQTPVQEKVQQNLFGRPRPMMLDESVFPDLSVLLNMLRRYRRKLGSMVDEPVDSPIVLAEDTIAAIDADGTIYFGATFLMSHAHVPEILVGVLAHEVGHRPKYWQSLHTELGASELTRSEVDAICRHEETRADMFAGKGLAELGMSAEPIAEFIQIVQANPHPQYLAGHQRAAVIREAHHGAKYRSDSRKKLFPEFHRATNIVNFIDEW